MRRSALRCRASAWKSPVCDPESKTLRICANSTTPSPATRENRAFLGIKPRANSGCKPGTEFRVQRSAFAIFPHATRYSHMRAQRSRRSSLTPLFPFRLFPRRGPPRHARGPELVERARSGPTSLRRRRLAEVLRRKRSLFLKSSLFPFTSALPRPLRRSVTPSVPFTFRHAVARLRRTQAGHFHSHSHSHFHFHTVVRNGLYSGTSFWISSLTWFASMPAAFSRILRSPCRRASNGSGSPVKRMILGCSVGTMFSVL